VSFATEQIIDVQLSVTSCSLVTVTACVALSLLYVLRIFFPIYMLITKHVCRKTNTR
jgi:hypothetical protein